MSKAVERELLEVAQWYTAHKDDGMGIEERLAFLTKAIDLLIWSQARAVEDIQQLEGRKRNGTLLPHDPYVMNAVPVNLRTATGNGRVN